MSGEQVPLALRLDSEASFDNFWPAGNEAVMHALTALAAKPEQQWLYLAGQSGSGVSHLLQATVNAATEAHCQAMYFDLREVASSSAVESLVGFEQFDLVVLDHIDAIAGKEDWELALFSLLNRLREAQRALLCGAAQVPAQLPLDLSDLRSRLAWAACYQLRELDDAGKMAWLAFMAERRGLELNDDVAAFMLRRCTRDSRSLVAAVERLDKASMTYQKRLTVPFVKQVLGF
ncbi:DnaA regulatory inactivator Hda [bacterium]|nr:DnaA regulatory inactivator Hda [bacterium]